MNGLILFSLISFLGFGVACFTTAYMRTEFIRYGFGRQRPLVGVLYKNQDGELSITDMGSAQF